MIAVGVSFPQIAIDNLGLSCSEAPFIASSFEGNPQHFYSFKIISVGSIMRIDVMVADESHSKYADEICEEVFISARERGTGIARRSPEYVIEKMRAGKAVIAIS